MTSRLQGTAPAGLQTFSTPLIPNSWYPSDNNSTAGTLLVDGTGYTYPVVFTESHTFQAMGFSVNTIGTTGSVAHLGIYADNGSGYPGALVQDLGTVATTTVGVQTITASITLSAGVLYWLVCVPQGAPTTQFKIVTVNGSTSELLGNNTPNGKAESWVTAGIGDGALPATWPTGGALAVNPPVLQLEA